MTGASTYTSPTYRAARQAESCAGKKRYPNGQQAHAVFRIFRIGQRAKRAEAYRCTFCGGWHIGTRA